MLSLFHFIDHIEHFLLGEHLHGHNTLHPWSILPRRLHPRSPQTPRSRFMSLYWSHGTFCFKSTSCCMFYLKSYMATMHHTFWAYCQAGCTEEVHRAKKPTHPRNPFISLDGHKQPPDLGFRSNNLHNLYCFTYRSLGHKCRSLKTETVLSLDTFLALWALKLHYWLSRSLGHKYRSF